GILKRHYLKNYLERDDVVFLSGEFVVDSVQAMGRQDVFQSGLVIRGRSTTFPDAILDLALPSPEVPELFDLKPGSIIQVEESGMCAALLNVERRADATMVFTVVPLVTLVPSADRNQPPSPKNFEFAEQAQISLQVPEKILIEPERWPISDEIEIIEEMPVELDEAIPEPDGEAQER
ncbi:MAG: hypothetical protein AAGC68_09065, partial [Verrucomicrobiota bacterium]